MADPKSVPEGENNKLIQNVSFEFGQTDYTTAYARFTDAQNERFSIPESLANKPQPQARMRLDMCGFELLKNPFGFRFVDTRDKSNVLLTTEGQTFIMYDKYMQLDLTLPSHKIYGLGERTHEFTLGEGTWTMWSKDQNPEYDDGKGGKQGYGVHPFVLVRTAVKGEYMGLYFRNSNAMSPVIRYTDDHSATFSFITTGGQMEIYFMFKGSAKQIIAKYQSLVGKPVLPPLWALGWHASSSSYKSNMELLQIMMSYNSKKIPLEVLWFGADLMDDYQAFSVNETAFPDMTNFTNALHIANMRAVVQAPTGMNSEDATNPYFAEAVQNNLLLQSSINQGEQDGYLTQHVYSNHTVFPDFMAEGTSALWEKGLKALHDKTLFDGVYMDMNEPAGLCDGECPNEQVPAHFKVEDNLTSFLSLEDSNDVKNYTWWYSYSNQTDNSTFTLPFIPGGQKNLDSQTLSLNATHPSNNETEYNLHSLYGHSQGKVVNDALKFAPFDNNRRFIMSRSTFAGSGQYMQHWLGKSQRTWESMRSSIAGIMNFNMFGIPFVGADVCGTVG